MPSPAHRRASRLSTPVRARIGGTLLLLGALVMIVGWLARLDAGAREVLFAGTALALAGFGMARSPSMLLYLVLAIAIGWFPLFIFRPVESLVAIGIAVAVAVWWQRRREQAD